jgi:hypothetical protein
MLRRRSTYGLFLLSMLLAPTIARADAISVNGICELGDCVSPDALNPGGSTSGNFSYVYTFGDGDKYSIAGSYASSYLSGSTSISFSANANYIGTGPSVGPDTLSVDLLQDYNVTGNPDGTYSASATLTQVGDAPGSSTSAQLFYEGQGLGLMGPYFGPGSAPFSTSQSLVGLNAPLAADFNYTFFFEPGTSSVPEPASGGFAVAGLLAVVVFVLRRKQARTDAA